MNGGINKNVPFGPWWAASLLFAGMLTVPALRVLVDVLILRQAPDEQRGRIVAAVTAASVHAVL